MTTYQAAPGQIDDLHAYQRVPPGQRSDPEVGSDSVNGRATSGSNLTICTPYFGSPGRPPGVITRQPDEFPRRALIEWSSHAEPAGTPPESPLIA